MPTSHLYQLNEIVELIVITNPKSILDIGVGFGKYGFLSREYLELWDGREKYSDWKRRIDGIEIFKQYLTPIHDFFYNHIYIGNAIDIVSSLKTNYDLILLIDILEHFDYKDGINLLRECKKHGKNMIISTPNFIGSQKDSFNNPFEAHKFRWRKKHFDKFVSKFFIPNDKSLICYIGDNSLRVRKSIKKLKIESKIIKYLPPFLINSFTYLYRIINKK